MLFFTIADGTAEWSKDVTISITSVIFVTIVLSEEHEAKVHSV